MKLVFMIREKGELELRDLRKLDVNKEKEREAGGQILCLLLSAIIANHDRTIILFCWVAKYRRCHQLHTSTIIHT